MKLSKVVGFFLVFAMVFSLLAVSASAILSEDQNNVNEQGVIYREKNGPMKSERGYLAVGGEVRPEEDDPFFGVRPPQTIDGIEYEQYVKAVTASTP